jgi:hypothetical protein
MRKPISSTVKATRLSDPQPEFVSMVYAAASQTPFRRIKSHEEDSTMSKITALKQEGYEVSQVRFPAAAYTEASVKTWMDANGYDEFTLKSEGEGDDAILTVSSEDAFVIGSAQRIDAADGMMFIVGKLATPKPAAGTETLSVVQPGATEEAAKSDEGDKAPLVIKARGTKAADDAPVEDAAVEDAAVEDAAVEDVKSKSEEGIDALFCRMEESLSVAQKGGYEIRSLTDVLSTLRWLLSDLDGDESTSAAFVKQGARSLLQGLSELVAEHVSELSSVFKSVTKAAAEEPAAEPAAEPAVVAVPAEDGVASALKSIAASTASLTALMAGMSAKIDGLQQPAPAAYAPPARKGSDETPAPVAPQPSLTSANPDDTASSRRLRSLLGGVGPCGFSNG